MASSLHYLTVQDVLWINLQATKKVHHFNYARLEEATYYQYAYGESSTLLPQAARFVHGFLKMHPLEEGNAATAFIGLISFLKLNGRCIDLDDDDGFVWFGRVAKGQNAAQVAIDEISRPVTDHLHVGQPDVRACIKSTINDFPRTIEALEATGHVTA